MRSRKLENYLRTYRKRAALSQREVAFLLGCRSGSKVSRYEGFGRQPNLRTVLAYEALFGVPPRELFAGVYRQVERDTVRRSRALARKLSKRPDRLTPFKLAALRTIWESPVRNSGRTR